MANLEQMRPCIRRLFERGQEKCPMGDRYYRQQRRKITHAIIFELNRLGYDGAQIKEFLLQWNERCYSVLPPAAAQRELCDYVDWFFKHECKLSCKALQDYCLYPTGSGCAWQKKTPPKKLSYGYSDALLFLEREFPEHGNGHTMGIVLSVMLRLRREWGRDPLYVGMARICAEILDEYRTRLEPMQVSRALYRLADAGFLEIKRGQRGTGYRKSNEYRFLDWEADGSLHKIA